MNDNKIITIEKTSKKIKSAKLTSMSLMFFGFIFYSASSVKLGFIMMLTGVVWYIQASVSNWWNHG